MTLVSVCWMDVNTPRLDSTKYRKATATNSTTQATRDMRKLNFITDQGSSRETTRSARRAWVPGRADAAAPPSAAPPAAVPGDREPALNRPRGTENVVVRLRPSSFTAGGPSAGPGLAGVLARPALEEPGPDEPGLDEPGLDVLPAGSVSEAG